MFFFFSSFLVLATLGNDSRVWNSPHPPTSSTMNSMETGSGKLSLESAPYLDSVAAFQVSLLGLEPRSLARSTALGWKVLGGGRFWGACCSLGLDSSSKEGMRSRICMCRWSRCFTSG